VSSQKQLSRIQKNIVILGILTISIAGWYFLFTMDSNMSSMPMDINTMSTTWLPNTYWMPPVDNNWGSNDFYQLIIMWIIMMTAMMSPSIIPTVLMFATVNKSKQKNNLQYTPTYIFYFGYLIAWVLFSIVISVIQYPLHQVSLMNPMMSSINNYLSGIVLIIAGIYQLTPYKNACLVIGEMLILEHYEWV